MHFSLKKLVICSFSFVFVSYLFGIAITERANATHFGDNGWCTDIQAPNTVSPGQTFAATVKIYNGGSTVWESSQAYSLGSTNAYNNTTWGLNRVLLPSSIGPGSTAGFWFNATAPSTPGTYTFSWQMVQDGHAWFGGECIKSITVSAPPTNGSCSATHYNCSAGNLGVTAEYSNQWQWWCNGSNGGSNILCAEAKPQCSDSTDNDSDGMTDYPNDPGCSSGSDTDEYNAPLVPGVPTGLTITQDPTNENWATVSWNAVPGAAYYSLRVDNNSNTWKYTNDPTSPYYIPGLSNNCNNDIVDGNILSNGVFAGPPGGSPGVDSCGNINTTSIALQFVANSPNHIWVTSRAADGSTDWASADIYFNLPPPSPSNLSAVCDTSGNVAISWNPVPAPGGPVNRHYSLRVDNQSPSWQYDVNNYPINHNNCANDFIDANTLLSVPSGSGTDYCGNMTNTSWSGVVNPSGTHRAWVHTKSRDFLTFGLTPPTYVDFTCSAPPPPPTQCSNGIDDADPEDTLVDMADPGCSSASDTDETNSALPPPPTQCSNGIDDADPEDTLVDMADPGCSSASDTDETNSALPPGGPVSLTATPRISVSGINIGTLSWETNGYPASSCSIAGGSLGTNLSPLTSTTGSYNVGIIYAKTTYTLTCGAQSDTATFEIVSTNFET